MCGKRCNVFSGCDPSQVDPTQLYHIRKVEDLVQARPVVGLVVDQACADVRVEADDAATRFAAHLLGKGIRRRQSDKRQRAEVQRINIGRDRRHVLQPPVPGGGFVVIEGVARLLALEIDEGQHCRPVEPRHVAHRNAIGRESGRDLFTEEIRRKPTDETGRDVQPGKRQRNISR